ncbi:thiamine-phosphate kinase [Herminiimonas fonticola]|uniref:Thiamine-monophosphate kinase n=1 Tax=Herminiimonas fonticola TaxID=303380 RepID=A0A4V3BVB4_9BURK|nr:thiamine-phosphate kinase [Herminiimonas fonticola]RBA23050.1 thiL: thiamine-monophosphate kinase [Herminiimonas fonticola]TDN89508.1 thiamine-phosphate kinase [Herminiimonas fonticola]
MSEFDLIARYFVRHAHPKNRAMLGIGDDCALLLQQDGMQTAISSDMLVEGRHFFAGTDAYKLGHKSLAVNLSDLAAMGAEPVAFTLALSLPKADEQWLEKFSAGLFALADEHNCELIGGDTTKGPLNICITIFGQTPIGTALRRDTAQIGDDIWVSGTLGDARLALGAMHKEYELDAKTLNAAAVSLHTPQPRVALGLALRGVAHSALDVSDGLIGDLGHILKKSGLGATLNVDTLPAGAMLQKQSVEMRRRFTLAGGDDYELCFTAPASRREEVLGAALAANTSVTRIGSTEATPGTRLLDSDGKILDLQLASFDHFA